MRCIASLGETLQEDDWESLTDNKGNLTREVEMCREGGGSLILSHTGVHLKKSMDIGF